jgi:hypothetical protein
MKKNYIILAILGFTLIAGCARMSDTLQVTSEAISKYEDKATSVLETAELYAPIASDVTGWPVAKAVNILATILASLFAANRAGVAKLRKDVIIEIDAFGDTPPAAKQLRAGSSIKEVNKILGA